jgi:hypothetical protein
MVLKTLEGLSDAVDMVPCVFDGNPLNLLFLDDVRTADSRTFARTIAAPELVEEERLVFWSRAAGSVGLPRLTLRQRPDPTRLSERLFARFDRLRDVINPQSDIGARIEKLASATRPDVVALVVVDGLSYYDLPEEASEPWFVDGPSITQFGFREVMGAPTVSQRLFRLGYRTQRAFTYFDHRDNPLAQELHRQFGDTQVVRINEFSQVVQNKDMSLSQVFVQVTMPGLDALAHNHRDRPPIEHYKTEIMARFSGLVEALETGKRRVLACLTADHGILWRECLPLEPTLYESGLDGDFHHPRFLKGAVQRDGLKAVRTGIGGFGLLRYPYLTRRLRRTEWGVHGGISAWESLVPLVIHET